MNLKRKTFLWIAILLGGVVVLGVVSVWNLTSLWRAARGAAAEYDAMDHAEAAVAQDTWLRDALRQPDGATFCDVRFFDPIRKETVDIVRQLRLAEGLEDGDGVAELQFGNSAADHLDAAIRYATGSADGNPGASALPPAKPPDRAAANAAAELEQARQSLIEISRRVPASARHHVSGAADRLRSRLTWTCVWLLIVLAISAAVHAVQYRALVRPLLWLRQEMRRSAANGYNEIPRPTADVEFKDVAAIFNGLARDLADLYRNLEQKVIQRSRELVRSERLASVGFLAAGVAHEINNPLTVISGYAELAGKKLRRLMNADSVKGPGSEFDAEAEAEALHNALEAQGIIHDEAFRCKEITSRLLSLARGGCDDRQLLCLDEVARQVAVLTKGLKNYRDRRVVLEFEESGSLEVVANATEMKQVLLNLTVNALEAVSAERGEVRISGRRAGDWVEVSVQDNGKGMTPETIEQVFEPFFTAKRGAGEPGTGLGLSITHAIIENHGGRLRAESDGLGRGSRFTVRLPAGGKALASAAHGANGDEAAAGLLVPGGGGPGRVGPI
jgi:signal transduction histidine kinase